MSLYDFCETKKISDLFKIIYGTRFSREVDDRHGIPIIRGRDLSKINLSIDELEKFKKTDNLRNDAIASINDILIQKIGLNPKCALVNEELKGCYVGDTVLILRPIQNNIDANAIIQFLSSNVGQELLQQCYTGAYAPTLTIGALKNVSIPIIPLSLSKSINESELLENKIRNVAEDIRSKRSVIFGSGTEKEFLSFLNDIKTSQTIIESGFSLSSDLLYRIRNFYPLPIAYPYRLIEAEHESIRILKQIYQNSESMVAFLASISLALSKDIPSDLTKYLQRAWGGKGATFGNWFKILTKSIDSNSKEKSEVMDSIRFLLEDGNNFQKNIKWLIDRRDELHHDDLPAGKDVEKLIDDAKMYLDDCLKSISFILQYELLFVLDYDIYRDTNKLEVTCLDYKGDHPGCKQVKKEHTGLLKKQDLYIRISEEWISLYPFISIQYCHHCKSRETYYIDSWDNKTKEANLKSFERAHSENSASVNKFLASYFQN